MNKDFIIIKYFVESPLMKKEWGRITAYAKITERLGVARSKEITKEQALETIKQNNLVEVLKTADGKVWADKKETFKHLYAGDIHIPDHIGMGNEKVY